MIRLEQRDRVAVVTLDDPTRRNALSKGLVAKICEVFDRLEDDPGVGAVVVTGAPPAFCAGADLGDLATAGKDEFLAIYEGFLRVARSFLPTVAAVNGPAIGAGMNLALGCDVRIAATTARFDTRFLQLGIHPGGGHTWMLRDILGPEKAKAMVLFGETLDGAAALEAGLVHRCVEPDDLLSESIAFAARATTTPRDLNAAVKETITDMGHIDRHSEAVDRELVSQLWSVQQGWMAGHLRK